MITASYPRSARLIRPYTYLELPGWGKLFNLFRIGGGDKDHLWHAAPRKTIRGKWHGFLMELDLANWSERHTYFLGRYYDLATQLALKSCLRPGDRFIDIGANIGMITLYAAYLVGADGCVEAVEPNPACCERINRLIQLNGLKNVTVFPYGLADAPGTLTLSVVTAHTGMGTLAPVPEKDQHLISTQIAVPVATGDQLLSASEQPVRLIKIDVEGFECKVLRGLSRLMARFRPAVVTEAVPAHLARAGSSVAELFDLMKGHGYEGYALETSRHRLRHRLCLRKLSAAAELAGTDVLWIAPDNDMKQSELFQPA
jgi:FkbM family methyltransferase